MKNYLTFTIFCKTLGGILQSDIGAILHKNFGWKDKDFIWANNSISPSLIRDIKELLMNSSDSYEQRNIEQYKGCYYTG